MRLWVHQFWNDKNRSVCKTCGPRDDKALENMIADHNEETVQLAWALYIHEEPSPYCLASDDPKDITRFPLSAFLAVHEGYLVRALTLLEEFRALRKDAKEKGVQQFNPEQTAWWKKMDEWEHYAFWAVARKRTHASVRPQWGEKAD